METNNMTSMQKLLDRLSVEELRAMLDEELHSEPVNDDAIRLIMSTLQERKKAKPVEMTPELEQAWTKYQRRTKEIWDESRKRRKIRRLVLRAASVAAILALLLLPILPQEAGAQSLWEKFVQWTTEVMEFFSPADNEGRVLEYEFKTDHPGLQQVYDTVVELGITEPVVPMWLPEGYELVECKVVEMPSKTRVNSIFRNEESSIVYYIDIYDMQVSRKYQKDDRTAEYYEYGEIEHFLFHNLNQTVAVWSQDKIECLLSTNSQEDTLFRVLKSIYETEDK